MFWLGCAGYLVLGVLWSRTQVMRLARLTEAGYQARVMEKLKKSQFNYTWFNNLPTGYVSNREHWDTDTKIAVAAHLVFWPVSLLSRVGVWLVDWVFSPVNKHREKTLELERIAESFANSASDESLSDFQRADMATMADESRSQAKARRI